MQGIWGRFEVESISAQVAVSCYISWLKCNLCKIGANLPSKINSLVPPPRIGHLLSVLEGSFDFPAGLQSKCRKQCIFVCLTISLQFRGPYASVWGCSMFVIWSISNEVSNFSLATDNRSIWATALGSPPVCMMSSVYIGYGVIFSGVYFL